MAQSWQKSDDLSLPAHLMSWLLDKGSLTKKLKAQCEQFSIDLKLTRDCILTPDQQTRLGLSDEHAMIREVILKCDQHAQVFAQSIFPLQTLSTIDLALETLGELPLGEVIFQDPQLIRHPFEIAQICASHLMLQGQNLQPEPLWARRSVFELKQSPMIVTEVFLPGSFAYECD